MILNLRIIGSSSTADRWMPSQRASNHDDVIKWKHFPLYWLSVRGIHRSPVNSPHKGQWRGALMISLICARINGWVNNREPGDLRRHHLHYDVIVMGEHCFISWRPHDEYFNDTFVADPFVLLFVSILELIYVILLHIGFNSTIWIYQAPNILCIIIAEYRPIFWYAEARYIGDSLQWRRVKTLRITSSSTVCSTTGSHYQ